MELALLCMLEDLETWIPIKPITKAKDQKSLFCLFGKENHIIFALQIQIRKVGQPMAFKFSGQGTIPLVGEKDMSLFVDK